MAEHLEARELRGWLRSGDTRVPDDREDRLLPWRSVRDITGLSRTTIWRMQRTGEFPLRVPISPHRVGWWESELTAWKAKRRLASASRPQAPYSGSATVRRETTPFPVDRRVMAEARSLVPIVPSAEPVVRQPATSRRARPRAVSPDQIDFGF